MGVSTPTLQAVLDSYAVPGSLYERLDADALRCVACGHRCLIRPGRRGACLVRENRDGTLFVPRGYVGPVRCEPVEKKPFFHVLPGSTALSFGMLGCDYHCSYCQNWLTSQALRDPAAGVAPRRTSAEELVRLAQAGGSRLVVSTYNEPLITSEWAVEVFRQAKHAGLVTAYVSNGNATPEALEHVRPWLDCYKVDLKGFDDERYRRVMGGRLSTVRETIRRLAAMGVWVEVVTLVIPGFNDQPEELRSLAEFLACVSRDLPWHVTAFHKDYRMTDPDDTQPDHLIRAAEIGRRAGLRFVYAGNLPGQVGDLEQTACPGCGEVVIQRRGYTVLSNRIRAGRCPACESVIPGIWFA